MKQSNIDSIVRQVLLDEQLPIHYYLQLLSYALTCVNELNYDVLRNVKAVRLTPTANGIITLPTDYVDWVRVGVEAEQWVQPLAQERNLTRLESEDGLPFTEVNLGSNYLPVTNEGYWLINTYNEYGEHLGKVYGLVANSYNNFKVIPERGVMQLDRVYNASDTIYLEYIYDGNTGTSTLIHPYAEDCIRQYMIFRFRDWDKLVNRLESQLAERRYYNSLRTLRARMNKFDKNDILRAGRKRFKQAPKL